MLQFDTALLAAIGILVAFPAAVFSFLKVMYHLWFVLTGVRDGKNLAASLLGPFALLVPSLFDERAQSHLRRLNLWLPLCMATFGLLFFLQWLASPSA